MTEIEYYSVTHQFELALEKLLIACEEYGDDASETVADILSNYGVEL